MQQSKLKGLWIPFEILTNEKLSDKEKVIYCLILFFSKNDGFCTSTNKYIADIVRLSDTRVSKLVSSLSKKNYIRVLTNSEDESKKVISRKIIPLVKYDYPTPSSKSTTPMVENDNRYSRNDSNTFVQNDKYKNNNKYYKNNKYTPNNQRTYDDDFYLRKLVN